MEKKRSVGVAVFGYLGIILGIFSLITGIFSGAKSPHYSGGIPSGLVMIFLSINLLRLRNWSRILLLILNCLEFIILTIGSLFVLFFISWEYLKTLEPQFPIFALIFFTCFLIIYNLSFLIYFTRPKVKEQFK